MKLRLLLFLIFAMVVAACGGGNRVDRTTYENWCYRVDFTNAISVGSLVIIDGQQTVNGLEVNANGDLTATYFAPGLVQPAWIDFLGSFDSPFQVTLNYDAFGISDQVGIGSGERQFDEQIRPSSANSSGDRIVMIVDGQPGTSIQLEEIWIGGLSNTSNPFPSSDCALSTATPYVVPTVEIPTETPTIGACDYATEEPVATEEPDAENPLPTVTPDCYTPTPSPVPGWCVEFDFRIEDYDEWWRPFSSTGNTGVYVAGVGWQSVLNVGNQYQTLQMKYDHDQQGWIDELNYVQARLNATGIATNGLFDTYELQAGSYSDSLEPIPLGYTTFEVEPLDLILNDGSGQRTTNIVVDVSSHQAYDLDVNLEYMRVEGNGENPFVGAPNCGAAATPTPTETPTQTITPTATPTGGNWCYEFDFTVSDGGFILNPSNQHGVWVDGVGWQSEYEESKEQLFVQTDFTAAYIERYSTNFTSGTFTNNNTPSAILRTRDANLGIFYSENVTYSNDTSYTFTTLINEEIDNLRFITNNDNGDHSGDVLTSIQLEGKGFNPFGATNCFYQITPSPYPTFTPFPTQTLYPTFTPGGALPTYTPYPTFTPQAPSDNAGPSSTPAPNPTTTLGAPPTMPPEDSFGNGDGAGSENPSGDGGNGFSPGTLPGAGEIVEGIFSEGSDWANLGSSVGSGLSQNWNNAPAQTPPGLFDCVERPLDSNICAVYYILENTLFAGTAGSLLIPLLVIIMDLSILMTAVTYIKTMLGWAEDEAR